MKITLLLLGISIPHLAYADQTIAISDFDSKSLSNWESKSFVGTTNYSIVDMDNIATLKAESHASASGIAKEKKIDLKKTPYINWSWRIDNKLPELNETTKKGDDYSARLYIVKDGGWTPWNTLALNYVWSSNQDIGRKWDNAFVSDNAKMIAVQGKDSNLSTWYTEKRDVYADMSAQFGDKGSKAKNEKAYRYVDAVALMTDTDNSKLDALVTSKVADFDLYLRSDAVIEGSATSSVINLDNSTNFNGAKFNVKTTDVKLEDSSDLTISVDESITIAASGNSEVYLYGSPVITITKFEDTAKLQKKKR